MAQLQEITTNANTQVAHGQGCHANASSAFTTPTAVDRRPPPPPPPPPPRAPPAGACSTAPGPRSRGAGTTGKHTARVEPVPPARLSCSRQNLCGAAAAARETREPQRGNPATCGEDDASVCVGVCVCVCVCACACMCASVLYSHRRFPSRCGWYMSRTFGRKRPTQSSSGAASSSMNVSIICGTSGRVRSAYAATGTRST
jgi:hypothetical protein